MKIKFIIIIMKIIKKIDKKEIKLRKRQEQ